MSDPTVTELIDALSRPAAWPDGRGPQEIVQTHASVVFIGADRVYKVKKPVDLGFLDFSTLAKRGDRCRDEVRLNRRLAPEIYLGVATIVRDADGSLRIVPASESPPDRDAAPPVEYAVEMLRLPRDRMLDRLLDDGAVDRAMLTRIVDRLLAFHAAAATGPAIDRHGTPAAVGRMVGTNLDQLERFTRGPAATVPPVLHARLVAASRRFVERHEGLLAARVRAGRIRDGHGDLHARNICVPDDRVVIYDCIEFSEAFRCADVARDIAFLLVDLEARGDRALARFVTERYAAGADDPDLPRLLPFYESHLACVLAKVDAIAARDPALAPAERDDARLRAMRYAHLAARFVVPPSLVLVCGLPGAGKSTVARRIEIALAARVCGSDVTRKTLAGLAPAARTTGEARDALYAPSMTERTYAVLARDADDALASGRTAVVDATLSTASRRAPFVDLAARRGVPLVVVHLDPPEEVVRGRLARRAEDPREPSDAGLAVRDEARRSFMPPAEIAPSAIVHATVPDAPDPVVSEVLVRLLEAEPDRPEP